MTLMKYDRKCYNYNIKRKKEIKSQNCEIQSYNCQNLDFLGHN